MRRLPEILVLLALAGIGPVRADTPSPYTTERQWIVATVCRNAFELLSFAKDKKGILLKPAQVVVSEQREGPEPGATQPTFTVTVNAGSTPVQATVTLTSSIWSAAAYEPFCRAAAAALKISPSAPEPAQGNPLHALLTFTESDIQAENHRVSQWLESDPANAAAHQQAALILGTLAMKENSGLFWDPREMCSRACAHLAVAQVLQPGPLGVEGQLADCLIGLIADTKTACAGELDTLAASKGASPDLLAWVTADRMRNSRDWRIVKDPATATALEQVEYFRALGEAANVDLAIDWAQKSHLQNRPDWARITMEEGFSVEAGHLLVEPSIGLEIRNMQASFPGHYQGAAIIDELNVEPGDVLGTDGHLAVIDRGMWARYFQRHLCQAIADTGDFFQNRWGVPENTQQLDQFVAKFFTRLTLYPYLQIINASYRPYPTDPAAAAALFQAHPEWTSFGIPMEASKPAFAALKQAAEAWFEQPRPMLPGTAYDAFLRLPDQGLPKTQIDSLYALAPLQFHVAELELTSGGPYDLARARTVLGGLLDYYTSAVDLARKSAGLTFDEEVDLARKSADIDPRNYYDLAGLYLSHHEDDQAAMAYQRWDDLALDRVAVSNGIEWLVNYYYDKGDKDHAMALAQEAAEVYSSRGLSTMMHLLERMNRLDEAESYGKKIEERYDEHGALAAFYQRHLAQNPAYKAKLDVLVKSIFPQGIRTVTVASFSGPPVFGMRFSATTDVMQHFGLSSDQVVVALDGQAIENQKQYSYVRELSTSPDMRFIVWDGHGYREIFAYEPGRLFGVDLIDYHR